MASIFTLFDVLLLGLLMVVLVTAGTIAAAELLGFVSDAILVIIVFDGGTYCLLQIGRAHV